MEASGGGLSTTNNRMELLACIKALEHVRDRKLSYKARVTSDSQYVVRGITEYCHKWRVNGWQHAPYQSRKLVPIKNDDMWKELYALTYESGILVTFEWVRGHNGHPFNERCDVLAGIESRRRIERLKQ